ncbi:MAG: hypothetical protein ACRC92_11025 [Peptostreptococcaceae bacterium]
MNEKYTYESPLKRIEDFNLLKSFLKETKIDNPNFLELGAGEGWFTVICRSHGYDAFGIDFKEDLNSIKYGYVIKKDVRDLKLTSNINVIHSNMFMYLTYDEILLFMKNNVDFFDVLFITYNSNRVNDEFDKDRINFFKESFFVSLAKKFNLEYKSLSCNKKRVLYKKGVIKNA